MGDSDEEFDFEGAGLDPEKLEDVELDFALETVVKMFEGLKRKGLSREDAATLTVEFLKKSIQPDD